MASRNMTALLAMLALAGWQNRDRLGELLGMATGQNPTTPSGQTGTGAGQTSTGAQASGAGGLGGLLGGLLGAGATQGLSGQGLSGALGDLLGSLTGSGQGDVANSWVQSGPNKEIEEPQLANALGSDTLDQLAKQTGLSRDELLSRLKTVLPTAVDKLTPQGRLPTEQETSNWSN
ncbi:YidB family protein [Mesorhizobium sp. BAC0120]|uniref:YidB family protein n=1 Tax=Mesorhizobium sp. BAC0120 TaxID=3090670 RepID=UPI00298CA9AF|nr:YidB family protein [Mesorhizobium sp. BAC0120]MDW6025284.1 YidB family protein [Mesorhizobium sp. BAC0120]